MPNALMTVDQWVELFRFIGLRDARMHEWHSEFERRHPAAHQSFLEWLGLSEERISGIRDRSVSGF